MKYIFLEKAKENLKAAEVLFDNDLFNASANRAYYASFHAAIASLYDIGIIPIVDHKVVRNKFSDYFFNKRKVLPSKFNKYLSEMQDKRNNADYRTGVSKKIARVQLNDSKEFVGILLERIK